MVALLCRWYQNYFSMEKQNFMCIIVFADGETNILQVWEGHNSFFSSETQKKILFDDMSQSKSVVSFSIKNSLVTQTRFWVDGEWNKP